MRSTLATRLVAASMAAGLAFSAVAVAAQDADTVRPASIHTGTCDSPGEVVAELTPLTVMFDDDDDNGASLDLPGDDDADDTDAAEGTTGDDDADDTGAGGGTTGDDDADDGIMDDDDDGLDDDDSATRLTGARAFQGAGGGFVGAEDASVVEGSEDSDVAVGLEALLAEPHIVAVFEGEGSDTIIACGSIGGFVSGDDDDLAVGLGQQNGSGFAGIAILDDDDDDNELDVDVYIARDVV